MVNLCRRIHLKELSNQKLFILALKCRWLILKNNRKLFRNLKARSRKKRRLSARSVRINGLLWELWRNLTWKRRKQMARWILVVCLKDARLARSRKMRAVSLASCLRHVRAVLFLLLAVVFCRGPQMARPRKTLLVRALMYRSLAMRKCRLASLLLDLTLMTPRAPRPRRMA